MNKICKVFLVGLLVLTVIPFTETGIITQIKAAGNSIQVVNGGNKITIGNEFIDREFSIENSKLSTTNITNKRTNGGDTVFTPAAGSEEFNVKVTKKESEPITLDKIDRSGWTAIADSYQNPSGANDGPASNLLDGNIESIWHTNYGGGTGGSNYPYNVLLTLNGEKEFQSFSYTPRKEGETTNGNIKGYQLWAATADNTLDVNSSEWVKIAEGDFKYNGVNPIYVNLNKAYTANQLKFVAISSNNGANFAGGAEFNLHKDKAPIVEDKRMFSASDLTLSGNPVVSDTTATINKIAKTGKKLTFNFEPYKFNEVTYTISENIVMYEGDHFMRKYMEISVPNEQKDLAVIDYIDLESLKVDTSSNATWTIPTDAGGVVEMDQFKANLGQPIYIQGMFLGCEFPAAETQIVDETGYMRYYTGKSFTQLGKDNQLTSDTNVAKYVTWQTVAGAATGTDTEVVQSDFYEYIKSIATPSEFRTQYNSWFDNMMNIDDKNILESFIEIDKELNNAEIRPLDSYVVDDGWNNYNKTSVIDENRSGTTLNQSGFWEFNSKFPDGLTPSSELVEKFGSNFGVWVGPRGGYNFYGSLADILTTSGKGSRAGGSIDVADRTYLKNFTEMATKWQDDYHVNYWKWDGFADRGQYNSWGATDGVPGYANNHMTGGFQHMYHVTDLWEGWIDLMEAARENADKNKIDDLWISLTCYVNPSPWYLQWANSVWIQCTADQADAGSSSSKMDRQMTYRDACYYDFLKNHEFQFPLSNLYNHDPVYGKEGTGMNVSTATDEQFQNYLYMLATRGTAFWELYYSDSIMSEGKYEVTGEFLEWAEDNYHILENAKMFGDSPNTGTKLGGNGSGTQNAYGFSCFDGTDGIISMRNASTQAKEITLVFDKTNGVSDSLDTYQYHIEHSYNLSEGSETTGTMKYGQSYTFTLQPDEVRILKVSEKGDTTAPKYTRAFTNGDKKITVKFNEKVTGSLFAVEGAKIASIEKNADDISYDITLTKALADSQKVKITAKDIKDLAGNELTDKVITTTFHENNEVINKESQTVSGSLKISEATDSLDSNNGFTVSANVKTTSTGSVVAQANGYELGITKEGKAYFTLNGMRATSEEIVNDGHAHYITGVKENNGILKLYVDATLAGSGYKAENRFFNMEAGATTIGNANFAGDVALKVFDTAYGYDKVANLVNPSVERKPLDPSKMSASVSGTSEGKVTNIFDNNPTTFWTSSEVASGINTESAYLKIDLGKSYSIDRFDYTKRFYNGAENMWKCTGNLRDYILEVSTDGVTWKKVSEGATFADEQLTEKGNGGTTEIVFDEIEAQYIRISGTKSYHWQESSVNKYMTVGDVKVFGKEVNAENIALNKEISAKWTSDDTNAAKNGDRPMSMAVDGIKNNTSGNYGEFGDDSKAESAYLELDLGSVSEVESINLYRYWADARIYKNTVIALSETKDFKDPTIVYNTDTNNIHGFGDGKDATYAESDAGKTFTLKELTKARYVRVYMNGTTTGGNTNHVNEIEVMGYQKSDAVETIDITALIDRLDVLSKTATDNATKDSVNTFKALVKEGYDLLSAGVKTQAELEAMITKLEGIENNLIDTTALKKAIKDNEDKVKVSTTSSVVSLNKKIVAAKALLENGSVEAIANSITEMELAAKGLVARGDTTQLNAVIQSYADLKEADYTTKTWNDYKTALAAAKAIVADNSNQSQEDVNKAKSVLEAAKKALVKEVVEPTVDKAELVKAINAARAIDKDIYTSSTYNVLKTAIERAVEFNESDTVNQDQVNEAKDGINDAILALVKRADTTDAIDIINAIDEEKLNESDYTESSWNAYKTARTALEKAIEDNSDINAEQMNALIKDLRSTKANLSEKPIVVDKTELENLYNKYVNMSNSGYTEISWNHFQNALKAAKAIIDNEEATETQILNVVEQLNIAFSNLKKATGNGAETGDTTNTNGLIVLMMLGGVAAIYMGKKKRSNFFKNKD